MTSTYSYYTKLRKEKPFFVEIVRIENLELKETLLVFNDALIVQELSEDIGNYFSWMSIYVKKHIKEAYKLQGHVKCTFYSDYYNAKKYHASIVINCDSEKDPISEAPLYQ